MCGLLTFLWATTRLGAVILNTTPNTKSTLIYSSRLSNMYRIYAKGPSGKGMFSTSRNPQGFKW